MLRALSPAFFALLFASSSGFAADASPPAPDANYDARNCEFYVNSLGYESYHYGGGGYDERRFVSYVSVDERDLVDAQDGRILRVGLLANGSEYVLGERIEPAYYKISITLYLVRYQDRADFDLHDFDYFVDVERSSGMVDRLWLKNGNRHFSWPSVLDDYPQYREELGPSYRSYVLDPSPIYYQKHACAH